MAEPNIERALAEGRDRVIRMYKLDAKHAQERLDLFERHAKELADIGCPIDPQTLEAQRGEMQRRIKYINLAIQTVDTRYAPPGNN
jgi:hypothetical protein